jgi:hypothetical protein
MKMEQKVFRNFGTENSDAGELPRRKHTIKTYLTKTEQHPEMKINISRTVKVCRWSYQHPSNRLEDHGP